MLGYVHRYSIWSNGKVMQSQWAPGSPLKICNIVQSWLKHLKDNSNRSEMKKAAAPDNDQKREYKVHNLLTNTNRISTQFLTLNAILLLEMRIMMKFLKIIIIFIQKCIN